MHVYSSREQEQQRKVNVDPTFFRKFFYPKIRFLNIKKNPVKGVFLQCLFLAFSLTHGQVAYAAEPIKISLYNVAIDLSHFVQIYLNRGNKFHLAAIPGADGIVRRIEVQAKSKKSLGDWAVFSIANPTDEKINRLIVAPHYRLIRSGIIIPDLGSTRIESITPSEGLRLDRIASPDSDIFYLTINPGSIITLVAELGSPHLPQLYLWEPQAYKDSINSYTLYHGILLGISALLALFLTILFFIKGTTLFPAAAAFSWAVLAYICVDFNFLNKIFDTTHQQILRAGTEVTLAASILIFLFSYLHIHRWHPHFRFSINLWMIALCVLGGLTTLTTFEPVFAAGMSRASFGITTFIGIILIFSLSLKKDDRAIMLIPTWILILFWLIGTYAALIGIIDNDMLQPALSGGLVLIVLLISITIMQHSFSGGVLNQGLFSNLERQALSIMGTDNIVWDWDVTRDHVLTSPNLYLGSSSTQFTGTIKNWILAIYEKDRDQFRQSLKAILNTKTGRLHETFRLQSNDGKHFWFSLQARPVISTDGKIIRCVGMLIDVTKMKKIEESLLHNSIHDQLTGLPNKQLFLDRLQSYCHCAAFYKNIHPTLLLIDFDNFRSIPRNYGISISNTFLLAITHRLNRKIKSIDTLCRLSVDQFALLLLSQNNLSKIASFTFSLKKALAMPVLLKDKHEISLTASIGLLPWTEGNACAEDLLNDVTLAMYHAKHKGGNRIEPFQPIFRTTKQNAMLEELQKSLALEQIYITYHPIFNTADGKISGFEATPEWRHSTEGILNIRDLITIAENANLIMKMKQFILLRVAADIRSIMEYFPEYRFFISINFPSQHIIHPQLIHACQTVLTGSPPLEKEQIKIKFSEKILIQNPELAYSLLPRLKGLGIGLILDEFGSENLSVHSLTRFPFDIVKLDYSLFTHDKQNHQIVLKSLISMLHDLGIKIIASGIENEKGALQLKDAYCEYLHSNSFYEGMTLNEAITLIKDQRDHTHLLSSQSIIKVKT
ncbi:MAG: Diguanylate cyclase (GGDEF) domain-containing protein [Candidatus Tokpelaia sp. JSC161]|jgi:diguanylate cyclase (GGDEF)-like protein/PAS domain S-box-containing protein|nr:MAG: Diguanylate cyclase (GGDEF) domain-containing protein [Candidatus Tokpelaia sp. JSC161]